MKWPNQVECCDNCDHCTYDFGPDIFLCNIDDHRIELHDEPCENYISTDI